jgi:ribonuclease HI
VKPVVVPPTAELLPETTPQRIEIPSDAIEIFTDGSCDPNPGPGGWGFAAFRGAEGIHEACGGDAATTNNRMELIAIIRALKWLDQRQPAILWTDSQYCQKGCTVWRHGWKRKSWTRGPKNALANAELWQMLDALLDARIVDVRWTRGHVGTVGNERADELADFGRQSILEDAA